MAKNSKENDLKDDENIKVVFRYKLRAVRNRFNYEPVPAHKSGFQTSFVDDAPVSVNSKEHFSKYKSEMFSAKNLRDLGVLKEGGKPITLKVNIPIAHGGEIEHVFSFFGNPPEAVENKVNDINNNVQLEKND